MKIIDFRVRAPYKTIGETYLFGPDADYHAGRYGSWVAPSAKQKSMKLLLQEMDEIGIVKSVVNTRKAYNNDNHDLLDLLQEYPDKFIGIPNIDPFEGEQALQEIDDLVINGPCSGIILEPSMAGMGLGTSGGECMADNDPRIYPIYEKCQNENIPVLITCSGLAYPLSDVTTPNNIEQIAADFPKLTLVITHAGWPWVQSMCGIAMRRGNVYLSPDCYLLHAPGWRDYVDGANYMLQDQFIFASAYPIIAPKYAVEYNLNCGFREEVIPKMMYENAARVLKLN